MQDQMIPVARIELERPARRPSLARKLASVALMGAAVGGGAWAWGRGYRPAWLRGDEKARFELVEVDRGDITQYVVEFGTVESASDAVVKCQVEALVGLVGGTNSSGTSKSGSGGTAGQTSTQAATPAPAAVTKSATSSTSKSSTGTAAKSGTSSTSGSSATSTTSASTSSSASGKPTIRSFSYTVTKYSPLKRTTATSKTGTNGSGGRSGGGGGRGGGGGFEEKPGSTRIISILAEGTAVKKGDVVCELDSAAFRDELKAQQIRWLQAKSYVEQAAATLAVNEITLREYRDGILPQDLHQVRQYIQTCEIDRDRAAKNLEWSQGVQAKGLRASSQVRADELAVQQADFVLSEAKGMLERLEKYTGPKILKSLEAKLASIRTDKLAQDASFALEDERLKRLEKNIAACTLRAPSDGVVVYVNQTNGWGRVESYIQEGTTVRQDQPIFQLPDPKRMRIKARINETKVAALRTGQSCQVRVDAYPERPLQGKVLDVTAISSPVNGPFSDVRVYFALISMDAAFADLRPGLSAEVTFLNDRRSDVERIPLASVRRLGGESFVAIPEPTPADAEQDRPPYRWQKVDLGLSDADYIEVVSGLDAGDRIIADPSSLDVPTLAPTAPQVAASSAD